MQRHKTTHIENSVYIGKRCRFPLSHEGRETHLTHDGIITEHYIHMNGVEPEDWYTVEDENGKKGVGRNIHVGIERQMPMPLECQLLIDADYTDSHPAAYPNFKSSALFKVDDIKDITVNAKLLCPNFLIMDASHALGGWEFQGSADEGYAINYSDEHSIVSIKIKPWPLSNLWDRLDDDRAKRLAQAFFEYRSDLPYCDGEAYNDLYSDMLEDYKLDKRFFQAVLNCEEKVSDMTLEHVRRKSVEDYHKIKRGDLSRIRLSDEGEAALKAEGIL